ncbi:hypothetical protein QBC46DRAFT_451495 [Diplogelasinospora grovesii]|uniref:Uncharacterized protein n=1 Tax=Diplogelasinospora grovesii TaxID=303347 RepID=A0AAN6S1U2_9PEZI|nr:hypothetical protein QBC46DRAFT_451495 [Diplogelasinospora grovesii]
MTKRLCEFDDCPRLLQPPLVPSFTPGALLTAAPQKSKPFTTVETTLLSSPYQVTMCISCRRRNVVALVTLVGLALIVTPPFHRSRVAGGSANKCKQGTGDSSDWYGTALEMHVVTEHS